MYVHNIRPWNYVNTYNKMTNPGIASRRVHRGRLPPCTKDYKRYLTKHCHIDLLRNGINSTLRHLHFLDKGNKIQQIFVNAFTPIILCAVCKKYRVAVKTKFTT